MLVKGKVFISHAHEDNARCQPLLAALKGWGVPYWFDTEQVTGGTELALKIQRAIEESQYFIRVCTLNTTNSFWVRKETGAFVSLQAEDFRRGLEERVLIPLILDPGYPLQMEDRGVVQIRAAGVPEASWLDDLRRALAAPQPSDVHGTSSASPVRGRPEIFKTSFIRTTLTTLGSQGRPNIFLLLDLDPNQPYDERKVEQRIAEMRNRWSREVNGVGRVALDAKVYLSLMSEIVRVMADAGLRSREAQDAQEFSKRMRHTALETLDRELAVAEAKGYVLPEEVSDFEIRYYDVLTPNEIRARVHVPIGRSALRGPMQPLDPTVAKIIADKLAIVHEVSLYTLLQSESLWPIDPFSTSAELCAAADALYSKLHTHSDRGPKVTAMASLAGHAKAIFSSAEMRARYDETLRRQPLEWLISRYVTVCAASAAISSEQVRMFLGEARRLGFDDEFAYEQLRALAERRHWSIAPRP